MNTYDEAIYKMLNGKGAMSDAVIDGDESTKAMDYISEMGISFHKKGRNLASLFKLPDTK